MKQKKIEEKTKNYSLYPMRINKYLAQNKHSTRRGADELIAKKQVFINGRLAILGDKIGEKDTVEVRFRGKPKEYVYFAYNKARGVITHSPQHGQKDIRQDIKHSVNLKDVFPMGRLDKDSHGLIILTNDGRITDKLLNPKYEHEKEYLVETREKIRLNFKERMEAGVNIEGYITKKCKVKVLGERSFKVTLTEGKKHQIRRMVVALFNDVVDLKRTKIMNIELGNIPPGSYKAILGKDLQIFLACLGI